MYLKEKHEHPRDKRIRLVSGMQTDPRTGREYRAHYYEIDGVKYEKCSVSALLEEFFPNKFDAVAASKGNVELQKQWKENGQRAADFGTMHHRHFENYLDQDWFLPDEEKEKNFEFDPKYPDYKCYRDLPAWDHFLYFLAVLEPYWQPYRVEWEVFSKTARLPGTIDLVLRDIRFPKELRLMVVDYKINKEPFKVFCKCGAGKEQMDAMKHKETCSAVNDHPLTRHLMKTKVSKASAQTAVYSSLLNQLYGANVVAGRLAYLHPDEFPLIHNVDFEHFMPLAEAMINSRCT